MTAVDFAALWLGRVVACGVALLVAGIFACIGRYHYGQWRTKRAVNLDKAMQRHPAGSDRFVREDDWRDQTYRRSLRFDLEPAEIAARFNDLAAHNRDMDAPR